MNVYHKKDLKNGCLPSKNLLIGLYKMTLHQEKTIEMTDYQAKTLQNDCSRKIWVRQM